MLFISRRKQHRVILKPSDLITDDKKNVVVVRGTTVEFNGGRFETEDPDIIHALLDPRHGFNLDYIATENVAEWMKNHPDQFEPQVKMETGARSTIGSRAVSDETKSEVKDVVSLEDMIAKKVEAALEDKMSVILGAIEKLKEPTKEPVKRVFKCKVEGCGAEFPTGFALSAHKKEKHIV